MKTWRYCRASRDDTLQAHSIPYQLDQLDTWNAAHPDLPPLTEPIIDQDVRGKVPFGQRPGGKRLLAQIGRGDVLLTWKLDRLSRKVFACMSLLDTLITHGVRVVVVADRLDFDSVMGRIMIALYAAFAELESHNISIRTKAALSLCKENGRKSGGTRPYGSQIILDGTRVKNGVVVPVKKLIPDAAEQAVLADMRAMAKTRSEQWVADELNRRGILTSTGRQWSRSSVRRQLEKQW